VVNRWAVTSLLALSTGCSAILGFKDGTSIDPDAAAPCEAGCGSPEGGAFGGGRGVVTTFEGAAGGIVALNGYVYLTYGNGVWGCSTTQPCDAPVSVFTDGTETRPLALYGSRAAWSHPVLGNLRHCFLRSLDRCATPMTYDEPGVQAITADAEGNLYWLRTNVGTGSSDLRVLPSRGTQELTTLATLPAASTSAAIVVPGPQLAFVMIGGVAYSVFTPRVVDAGPSTVAPLVSDAGAVPVATGIVVAAGRVVWPRGRAGGLWQCPIDETKTAPCNEGTAVPFASPGDDITALAIAGDTVLWARQTGAKSDVFACNVIAGVFTQAACTPVAIASDLGGRVSALTVEALQPGPDVTVRNAYFVVGEPSARQRLERAPLPR
jgi:hypothetical protein